MRRSQAGREMYRKGMGDGRLMGFWRIPLPKKNEPRGCVRNSARGSPEKLARPHCPNIDFK